MKHLAMWIFLFISGAVRAEDYDPITVYLTWKSNPATTIVIQWITHQDRPQDLIEYKRVGETVWKSSAGSHVTMPEKWPYFIHTAELTDLKPFTDYYFRTGSDAKAYKFRTMPAHLTTPIRFLVGGDIYHDTLKILKKMNLMAAHLDPMFVIAGGDLAYNDDKNKPSSKNLRWLEWLISWKEQMVTTEGRLIPIIPAIGNHDVPGGYDKTPADAAFFYALFAMPGLQGYNVLDFGDYMSLIILDSGHTHSIRGMQTNWLYHILRGRKDMPHKFAVYHVASYPSVRKYNGRIPSDIRRYWHPIFDQFGINIVFENHDHAYKRTWPIKGGKVNNQGVIYLGDGGWGVDAPRIPKKPDSTWYLSKASASRNVIAVTIHENERHIIAYDDEGKIIDELINK